MSNDHQFQAINLCNNWWNSTVRNPNVGFDYPSTFSCSTDQLLTNFTGNTCFIWTDVFDDKSARSCDESPGSVSNTSSITLNDIPPYSSDPMLDFSLLSPTMSWNQPFLSNDETAEKNLHGMLQEDTMTSESNQIQKNHMGNSSLNQGLLQNEQHRRNSDDYISSMGSLASQQMLHGLLEPNYNKLQGTFHESNQSQNGITNYSDSFHGRMDMQSQAVMDKVQQLVNASDPKQQLQLTNETAFWNPLASIPASLNMYHSMPNQLLQSDHSSISTNHSAKPNFGVSTSNSTSNKKIESEPALKKPRIQTPSSLPTFKVRKEKLGDRVTALQQLVSPFGKTDTASVLHEAIDYIKFLHDQVRALSTPYLKNDQQMQQVKSTDKHNDSEGNKQDLRSRGLCLVPISSTYPVAAEAPLDFWTPTFGASYM